MQTIDFTLKNYVGFDVGKKTTIRLGQKDYHLGAVKLKCEIALRERIAEIVEIRVIRFGDIGLSDAVADGFNTVDALRHELEVCYKKLISDFDPVTIIRLDI